MAALAVPLLEMAGEAIAAAWTAFASSGAATATAGGIVTAGVVIGITEAGKDQSEEQTKAQTDAASRTQSRDCKCLPDTGRMAPVNHSMSELSARYQQYVTGFPRGMEWIFSGKDFDGFKSSECLLQEAKAQYDQFFDPTTGKPRAWWLPSGGRDVLKQARAQNRMIVQNPPARLGWYFMQPLIFGWCTREFATSGFSILCQEKPMNSTD